MRSTPGLVRLFAALGSLVALLLPGAGQASAGNKSVAAGEPVAPAAPATPRVEYFSPQGYVRQVRQVVARFSDSMVALGDPRLADPFTVSCPARGKGRWADTRDWVFDFDADLDAGVRCRFTLKPDLKSLGGTPLAGRRRFGFETGGPAIVGSLPRDGWAEIDEEQVFLLRLDAQARQASIEAHAYCAVDGLAERIPVRVLVGAQRQRILAERRLLGYDYFWLLWKNGLVSHMRARDRNMEQREALITVLQCARRLPPGTRVLLHWGIGVRSLSGLPTREDQQLAFRVRPAFIAQVECTRANPRAGCVPVQPVSVTFTAPVPRALALAIRIRTTDGRLLPPAAPANEQIPTLEEVTFPAPFPEMTVVTVQLPAGLVDDSGRKLENAARFPLWLRIDADPPLAKFPGTFGILEAAEGGVLPVTLRDVEPVLDARRTLLPGSILRIDADASTIASWLTRVEKANQPQGEWVSADEADIRGGLKPKLADQEWAQAEEGTSRPREVWRDTTGSESVFGTGDATTTFTIAKPAGRRPEEVIGIPLGQPGFYVVELASRELGATTLGRHRTRYVSTSALVTDLAVHFLWGRESSLVWVTRLSNGRPVVGATVAINDFCDSHTFWRGHTGADGTARVDTSLGEPVGSGNCVWDHPLLVLAKAGRDFSFTDSNWSQGIGPYEFGLPVGSEYTANIYRTVLDRTLYRAGETVSMQHFLRRHVSDGLTIQPGAAGAHRIAIRHLGSGQEYTWDAMFDANGVATSQWKIPEEAKLGDYAVVIDDRYPSAQFKVEQFRLPSMRGSLVGPPRPLVAPHEVALDLHVAYLSGGGAGGLPVKVRTLVEPQPMQFSGYSDYVFGGNPVAEGISSLGQGPMDFDFDPDETNGQTARTRTIPLTLDGYGSARLLLAHLPTVQQPSRLTAELEYADANGELMTTSGSVRLLPAAISVGIRPESWIGSPDQLRFRVVTLGLDGKPVANQPVSVSLYQSSTYSYRKRLIGGFYAYETTRDTRRLTPTCSGQTNAQGLLSCEVAPGGSGEIIVRAETRDAQGNPAGATTSMWVFDGSDGWFAGTSGDRMDVLPERKEYQAGDVARFQVRMPFREATALVTVEREGVMRSFVTPLQGKDPIVQVPIVAADAPNVFVSVLAVRGRIAHAEPGIAKKAQQEEVTALVDLTKPAYRLGIAQIKVGWRPHRLDVQVQPARGIYEVRDRVPVRIHVARADGGPLPPGAEVAVAAVDEALLDLSPNESWKLLQAMMGQRGLEVWTSTAQMQVVGKRHYGRKAVPAGGGGGRSPGRARELFQSLLFWQPRIALNARGEASVTIPLNDSLSAFRIVAVADDGAQLYGTGGATIHTTQDLILTSGLPPLVRQGDHYAATFTVRNTTDHPVDARVQAVSSAIVGGVRSQTVRLAAGQARDLTWLAAAPLDADRIKWDVSALATRGSAHDRLEVSETAIPAYPVRTYQATIAQLTAPLTIPVERPHDAVPGRGGLQITLQPRLAGSLQGVREYMSYYPYICLEQQVSEAIALQSRPQWEAVMARLPLYMDADGLLKYFPTDELEGDDGLTAYVLSIAQEAGWPIDPDDRSRMLHALAGFVAGRIVRYSALPTADLSIRKLQAIDALARYDAAEPDMLDSITLQPNLMPTSALLDWIGILERTPDVPRADEKRSQAFGILRARLNFQGTIMGFSTERTDALWWLMISADSNANRMVLAALDQPQWRDDMPRLVRGALGRQLHGHWNTTVANAWGVLAMKKFSARFEATPVAGATLVRYGSRRQVVTWPRTESLATSNLPWQQGPGLLDIRQQGSGAPWAMVRAMAAIPLRQPLSTGFRITRTVTPIEQSRPGVWTRGDVARVHLELEAQSDMTWVVVDDPIPAGATILGSGLGGQSQLLTRGERRGGWAWLAYEERRFDGYRAYYELVPKGHWSVEYTVRFDNPGTFQLPATRVEAMYAPEMFGELPNAGVTVQSGRAVR